VEIPVLCLMVEGMHSKDRSDGATDGCNSNQRFLADAPLSVPCPFLIDSIQNERKKIDCKKVDNQCTLHQISTSMIALLVDFLPINESCAY